MRWFIFVLTLCLLGGIHFYMAHRLWRWIHCFFPKVPLAVPLIFLILMTVLMILSVARPFSGTFQQTISFVGSCWMGMFAYLLLFFLLSDLILWIPSAFRWLTEPALERLRLVFGIGATVLALLVSGYGFLHARELYTVSYEVTLSSAQNTQMNVVLISDVHLGAIGSEERLVKTVEKINGMNPDLVLIAGDFFDSDFTAVSHPEKAVEAVKKIRSRFGVYACLGNHDAGKTYSSMVDFLERANVRLLSDEYTVIDGRLVLAGRRDPSPIGGAGEEKRQELSKILEGRDPLLPAVVMDHNPVNLNTYTGEVDLVLCGHTHKGQIFPGELITNALFVLDYGYARLEHGTQAIVTSGIGIWGLPMRVGTDCEIVRIQLHL